MEEFEDLEPASTGQKVAERYEVLSRIGEGGMGIVYLANDDRADRKVVLKFPKKEILYKKGFRSRFGQEVKSLIRFEHPHVVRVYDVGTHQGMPFMVLQYLDGGTLAARIAGHGAQTVRELTGNLQKVAGVLDALHAGGTIHRDVKAANILFDSFGEPHISDFGIAKVVIELDKQGTGTEPGAAIGSPESLAPEHIHGNYTPAYDQYGLATVAYQALSGRLPFQGSTGYELQFKIIQEAPPRLADVAPQVGAGVSDVVMRGLTKNPLDRFASCRAFVQAMEEAARGGERVVAPVAAPPAAELVKAPAPAPAPSRAPATAPAAAVAPTPARAAPPVPPKPQLKPASPAVRNQGAVWRAVVNHWSFWILSAAALAFGAIFLLFMFIRELPFLYLEGFVARKESAEVVLVSAAGFTGAHLLIALRSNLLKGIGWKLVWALAPLLMCLSSLLLPLAEPPNDTFADGTLLVDWGLRLPIVISLFLMCLALTIAVQASALKGRLLAVPKRAPALVYAAAYIVVMLPGIVVGPNGAIAWAMLAGIALLTMLFRKVMPLLVDREELEARVGEKVEYTKMHWWPAFVNQQVLMGAGGWLLLLVFIGAFSGSGSFFADQEFGPVISPTAGFEGLAAAGFFFVGACSIFGLLFRPSILGNRISSIINYAAGGVVVAALMGTQSLVPLQSSHPVTWVVILGVLGGVISWAATRIGPEPFLPIVQPGPKLLPALQFGVPLLAVLVCFLLAPTIERKSPFVFSSEPAAAAPAAEDAAAPAADAAAPAPDVSEPAAAPASESTATESPGAAAPEQVTLHSDVLRFGTGEPIGNGDTIVVHYTGWLFDAVAPDHKGRQFDSSLGREPFKTEIGKGFLIEGWEQGLAGIQEGEKIRLFIPSSMAYGQKGLGDTIPPNSPLVFEIDVLAVNPPAEAPKQ